LLVCCCFWWSFEWRWCREWCCCLGWCPSGGDRCSLRVVIFVVVGDGYHKWWLLVLSWEAKCSLSLSCVVVSSRMWWWWWWGACGLCCVGGFVIFFLAGAEFATVRITQVVWCFCVVVISLWSRSMWRRWWWCEVVMLATFLVVWGGDGGSSKVGFDQNLIFGFDYSVIWSFVDVNHGVAAVKVDFVVGMVVVVVAKVNSLRWHQLLLRRRWLLLLFQSL